MDLDAGAVDEQPVRRTLAARQGVENILPNAALRPTNKPIVKRLLRTVDLPRAVGPASAIPQGVDDAAQNAPVINPSLAPRVCRQQRLDPRPLFIRKPKEIRHFIASSLETMNHNMLVVGILLMGPDPKHFRPHAPASARVFSADFLRNKSKMQRRARSFRWCKNLLLKTRFR